MIRASTSILLPLILHIFVSAASANDLITARVVGIADGDNIIVLTASNKRIIIKLGGIDCPEIGQAFAQEALQFTSDHCLGKTVSYRIYGIDIYNRIIATVYLDDSRELNLEILKAGLAWHYKRYSNRQDYADAQYYARAERLGLWVDKEPTPPWEWRRERRVRW
jgi:endonuclease YncB( thermonuclease family)